jgi:hypothetical protein
VELRDATVSGERAAADQALADESIGEAGGGRGVDVEGCRQVRHGRAWAGGEHHERTELRKGDVSRLRERPGRDGDQRTGGDEQLADCLMGNAII